MQLEEQLEYLSALHDNGLIDIEDARSMLMDVFECSMKSARLAIKTWKEQNNDNEKPSFT